MGCSCCEREEPAVQESTGCAAGCGCSSNHGHAESHGDAHSAEGTRARLEVRLLAARFVAASVLFVIGLVLSSGLVPVSETLPRVLFILSWLVAGYRVLIAAGANILRGRVFDENFLMAVATIGAFLIGQWSEGAAVMLFYNLGEMVQESAVNRSRRSISELMDVRPDSARLADGGKEVHPSEVRSGSLILVLPGEKVPLDGMIVEGVSSFDTSRLTGESLPRDAVAGSEALAGFVNGSGQLVIRTTAEYGETAASKMLELIEHAQNRKARAEKLITSFARVYTPIVTIGAALLAVVPPLVLFLAGIAPLSGWASFQPWVSRALVFLVISCPCAFVISVPLGFFGGIGGAARRGILVKGADYIDVLAKAGAVVFDKTGTLTRGDFKVRATSVSDGFVDLNDGDADDAESEFVRFASIAESRSSHPAGLAIRSYAAGRGIGIDGVSVSDVTERAGYGVSVRHDGKVLLAGSRRLMESDGVRDLPPAYGSDGQNAPGTVVELARDGVYIGRLVLGDEPKADSAEAVANLRALGIDRIVMLTGDTEAAARDIASRTGIDEIRSGVLPHQKVELFEEISEGVKKASPKATVVFVGDGINDAPVLSRADAGLAMGGIGSDAAIEAADVVLMNDNPLLVAEAIRSARWTRHIVKENIALSFAIKVGFLALGALGVATLWEAVFADVGVALLATANSLRARHIPRRK